MEYSEFYKDLLDGREECAWKGLYYGIFSKIIGDNDFKVCAEVGIGYGFHAREILENTGVEKLYLVDPMTYYPNDMFADDVLRYGGFELLVKNITLHLQEYSPRYTWFRCPSLGITQEQIGEETLDAVFIDGDHSYEAVTQDLAFWWKKLKKGGWLLGDDYQSMFPGTTRAVDEFSQQYHVKMELLTKPDRTYPIYKFVKE